MAARVQAGRRFRALDDLGKARSSFDVGETVYVAAQGLRPATVYELSVPNGGRRRHTLAAFMTDRFGALPPTALLPFLGLVDHLAAGPATFATFAEAERRIGGQKLLIEARPAGGRKAETIEILVNKRGRRPQIIPSDLEGRLQTGILRGEHDIAATLRNMAPGCVRVLLVAHQYDWQPGDPIEPVLDDHGAPVQVSATVGRERATTVLVWPRDRARPGSYQFVARSYRPGWYTADDPTLLPDDVVSSRRITSLVVRRPVTEAGISGDDNTVLTPEVAGRPLTSRPYFQFSNNFPKGRDVWAALDPDALPAGLLSQKVAIYVIKHKTAADWAVSSVTADISGPGMTPAVEIVPIVPGCINWNHTLVWPNPQTLGKYDIVLDFGNNDPMAFATDASFDPPLDMIDGYVRVGFYVTEDPSLPGPFAGSIGEHEYNNGSVQVPSTDGGPTPTQTLQLKAVIRYPAQVSGVDAPFQPGTFPLVVIVHGNSSMETSYLGYNYLLDHLAGHGFIAMSIYAPVGSMIETRARAIFEHLSIMSQANVDPGLFQGHIDLTHIGIMGHSRGAEAVVRAGKINVAEALGWSLQAGISLAPTDFFHYGDPGMPLLGIYGANDGDVSGTWGAAPTPSFTGFDIFDEAGRPRSFVFVYGATHDRFNTEWASIEATTELTWDIAPSDIPKLISQTAHQDVAKGYVTAFYQVHLLGREEQREYFTGELKAVLTSAIEIHLSHQESGERLVDDFQQLPHDATTNTLGGAVSPTALLSPPAENDLHTLDAHSPHQTAGGNISWSSSTGIYLSAVPAASKDVSAFTTLSFRVTQRYGSGQNPANQEQDLYVRLSDNGGKSRAIRVGAFTDIPFPYERGYTSLIKSALKSIRIPLAAYVVANAGAQDVDLTDIKSISFEFFAKPIGEIEIDDIEFGF
jgi:hypothetical protein